MLVFGDSIAKGVGVEKGSSWADLLAEPGNEVTNFAEDGERVEGTLEKVRDIKLSGAGEIAIIATGTNNCGRIEKGDEALEPDVLGFEKDFVDLLRLAKERFNGTVVIGLMPTDGTKMLLGDDATVTYSNETISEFNNLLARLCEVNSIPFVDLMPHFLDKNDLLGDHIHPNAKGHKIILRELTKQI